MPLLTRNVFIDTEFFVKANLDFNSRTIQSFQDLCEKDELKHITSTIVVKEVNRKIKEQIKEALKGIKNFRRKAVVLKDYEDDNIKNLFDEINEDNVVQKALEAFEGFLETSKTDILDMTGVSLDEVIEMHFNQISPFSAKKPNEFRDAFTLLAIRSALRAGEQIYIVSDDPDHKEFCAANDNFVNVETLSELLDIYNKHNDERTNFIEQFLDSKKAEITNQLKVTLEEAEAYNSSTWEDAEVDEFNVVELENYEPQIIHLDDEHCQIVFDVTAKFMVTVSGPDTANGYYDKEDGVLHTFDSVTNQEEQVKDFTVEMDLTFERDGENFINDEYDLHVKGLSQGIEFDIEETSYEDYR
ncbi:PIN domain-containing protein [Cronobacter turicensis]